MDDFNLKTELYALYIKYGFAGLVIFAGVLLKMSYAYITGRNYETKKWVAYFVFNVCAAFLILALVYELKYWKWYLIFGIILSTTIMRAFMKITPKEVKESIIKFALKILSK